MPKRAATLLALVLATLLLHGCAAVVGRATSNLAGNLSAGIENHDDPDTVATALPAYLLMLDGLIEGSPDNAGLLLAGARLYGVYAGIFVDQPERARRLARRAFDYAGRAFCPRHPGICASRGQPFESFEAQVARLPAADLDALYGYAAAWAGMIQADSGDWALIAEIPKVDALLQRVVALDPAHAQGQPWLYLGVLATLLPPAYGGKPEDGQAHFERALALSGGATRWRACCTPSITPGWCSTAAPRPPGRPGAGRRAPGAGADPGQRAGPAARRGTARQRRRLLLIRYQEEPR